MNSKSLQIIKAGLKAIKTDKIIKENIKLKSNILTIKNKKFNLSKYNKIYVIGFGKASAGMAKELEKILGNKIEKGIVISTEKVKLKKIKSIKGSHPFPSKKNIKATKKIIKLIKTLDKDDLLITLISGGGSSLLCYPNISFNKYLKIFKKEYNSGKGITVINKIRKKYSNVKNGKLAKLTKARIVSLIFSDVVGDKIDVIASGPTSVNKRNNRVTNIILLNNQIALEFMKKGGRFVGVDRKSLNYYLSTFELDEPVEPAENKTDYQRLCQLVDGGLSIDKALDKIDPPEKSRGPLKGIYLRNH